MKIIRRAIRGAAALAVLGGLVLAVRAFWLEPRSIRLMRYELSLPDWPVGCDGLRVAVLSDLHVGSPFNGLEKLRHIVELTQSAAPDLVLLPGDFVIHRVPGGRFVAPEATAKELGRLSAALGSWAVLGNEDWRLGAERVGEALESAGIRVLDDTAVPIGAQRCTFWLAGISDYTEGRHDVRRALQSVSEGLAVLAFTHNPDVFPEVPGRVSLTVAGHTHGGQVALPWIGRPIVPSLYGQRYAAGHIVEGGRHLFVSTGIGTSILPVRFRVPPEISLLTLRPLALAPRAATEREMRVVGDLGYP
jgi:predicted MPP superfamily phosphohydrolase